MEEISYVLFFTHRLAQRKVNFSCLIVAVLGEEAWEAFVDFHRIL